MVVNRRFSPAKGANSESKARVLIVDDHQRVLDTMSGILAADFDVAGVAVDGNSALEQARQLEPDVIVLDVSMPGLDGFQTARALARAGSRAPVVFLSMHEGDDYVTEAFRHGGRGYVVKSRARRDLASALQQVLGGGVFVPSLTPLLSLTNGSGHAMQIHDDVNTFADGGAIFLDAALRRGDATCIIVTERVRESLAERLRARGWEIGGPFGHRRCLVMDASDALKRFMRSGFPDGDRLAEVAAELDAYRRSAAEGTPSRLTIFGNMVVVLCEDGNEKAAIALESLWNTLTHGLPFFTLCGYAASCFHDGVPDLWAAARNEHWALSHASDV
jgi:CheY-like chemotaxis protein